MVAACSLHGALSINSLSVGNNIYTENFNGLGAANGTWTDNSTLTHWYSSETSIASGDGSATGTGLYNLADVGTPGNRSLGSVGGTITYGIQFVNNSGLDITKLEISYAGRTWRAGANANLLRFEYFVGDPTFVDSEESGWTTVNALQYNSGASATLNTTIENLSIADGQNFWFRWSDANSPGTDATLGIDDLSVTAVPEPSFYALAAVSFLGLIVLVREWSGRRCRFAVGSPA